VALSGKKRNTSPETNAGILIILVPEKKRWELHRDFETFCLEPADEILSDPGPRAPVRVREQNLALAQLAPAPHFDYGSPRVVACHRFFEALDTPRLDQIEGKFIWPPVKKLFGVDPSQAAMTAVINPDEYHVCRNKYPGKHLYRGDTADVEYSYIEKQPLQAVQDPEPYWQEDKHSQPKERELYRLRQPQIPLHGIPPLLKSLFLNLSETAYYTLF